MITQNIRLIISLLIVYLGLSTPGTCEPFIVLSYTNNSQFTEGDGNNEFSLDSHHSANYIVKQGDSLNSILKEFYTGSGLDRRFIQLSIVIANPHAFAKNNPNFLFSGKKLYLPGKSDIESLLMGKKINPDNKAQSDHHRAQSIYFFGG